MWVILQLSNLILKNATQACKKKDTVLRRRSYPAGCFTLLSLGYWPVTNQFQMHLRKCSAMQDASVVSANPGPTAVKKGQHLIFRSLQKCLQLQFRRVHPRARRAPQLCVGHSVRHWKLQAGNENADLELAFAVPKKLPIQTLSEFVL